MAYDLKLKDNYIIITNTVSGVVTDRPQKDIVFARKFEASEEYTIYWQRNTIDNLVSINWNNFTLESVPFGSQILFEDWIRQNTGGVSSSSTTVDLTPITDLLEGNERVIDTVESLLDGSTDSGVQSVGILFRGNNGTLDGVLVPNNASFSFSPNKGEDTIGSISYTVPTTGENRVIITYIRS